MIAGIMKMRILSLLPVFIYTGVIAAPVNVTPVEPVIKKKIMLFPLHDIRVSGGAFRQIMDLNHQYLLSLEPDRLLSWFRREAGLTPKAQPYPGWESEFIPGRSPLCGHMTGFYLSSMAMMFASTGDQNIIDKLNYTLSELDDCQQAFGNGFLLPTVNGKHLFEDVAEGKFKTSNPFINDSWEPVYVLNKIMLGLYRVYTDCNLALAKKLLIQTADWFGNAILNKLSHEQIQKLLFCEHGSINESFINVYQLTGDQKYLNWAKQLNDEDMWVPLSQGKDILDGWHANTQIPKFTGFENVYNYTGNREFTDAAIFFWKTIVDNRSWVIGGNSTAEHFFPKEDFGNRIAEAGGPESCNSVNMMRLTELLYQDYGDPEKIDYYERVLYNHILANYNPENGMCVYYTSMRPAHYKVYSSLYNSFWCCTGTGMEAPAKFGQMIYAHDNDNLYINMFIPSTLQWREKGITLTQTTTFPDEAQSSVTVTVDEPTALCIKIRQPKWLAKTQRNITLNGKTVKAALTKDGYIEIKRIWKNGDKIGMNLKAKLSAEVLPGGDDNYLALLYGPIVLANKVSNNGLTKKDFTHVSNGFANDVISMINAPSFTGKKEDIIKKVQREKSPALTFTALAANNQRISLIPFNRIAFSRYAVYFRRFPSLSDYQEMYTKEQQAAAEKKALDIKTVDRVIIGDLHSEQQHNLESYSSNSGGEHNSQWRDASNGGYFMYQLKVNTEKQQRLYIIFSGNDNGARIFDVLVDGKLLQTIDHTHKVEAANGGLYARIIDLPPEMISGKTGITVKFQARRLNTAGGVFDLRVIE